ncbi:DUF92 domain-containing protein [Alteribacter aurantiacus]|uniref:DUF92 domain-containing protein n=1 Tax=Alteribacter aurantiacus TaxID=254410 RepID=UPI00040B9F0B|nr:DUF92 domain-containing protein [Alteribacter aurantiacus]
MSLIYALGVLILAFGAWKKGSLTIGATFGAIVIGVVIGLAFELAGLLVLASFFITSSVLGKVFDKRYDLNQMEEKGNQRDIHQVLANGGWSAVCATLYLITSDFVWVVAFLSSMAAATSDTWASEFGRLSKKRPLDLVRLKPVEKGQSGAVSIIGTIGAIGGSLFVGGVGALLFPSVGLGWFIAIVLVGLIAQLLDTIVGGTYQVLYRCNKCEVLTEKKRHCEQHTKVVRGMSFVNNDVVNHVCTSSAVLLTGMIFVLMKWGV